MSFTTIQLVDLDLVLLGTFGLALVLNSSLFLQIMFHGVVVKKRDVWAVLSADLKSGGDNDAILMDGSSSEMVEVGKTKKEEDLYLLEQE